MVELTFVEPQAAIRMAPPIGVLAALAAGFDRLTARPILLLPSLAIDLFLWLGPRLRVTQLAQGLAASLVLPSGVDPGTVERASLLQQALIDLGGRLNLFSALSTLPVGIPSMMALRMPVLSPLGPVSGFEIGSGLEMAGLWLVLSLAGLGLGSVFHLVLARQVSGGQPVARFGVTWLRIAGLTLLAFVGALGLSYAILILITLVAGLVPWMGMLLAFLGFSLGFWVAVYLMFSPHGIVRYGLGLFQSMRESAQLVRWNLMGTTVFLTLAMTATYLTNWVWRLPAEDSWYSALAVMGHALVSATLLLGSYVFYQSRREWTVRLREQIAARQAGPPAPAG